MLAGSDDYPVIDERNAAMLVEAGVPIAIASFSEALGSLSEATTGKFLLVEAALATAYGLSDEDALKAITLYPAQLLGLDSRMGSLMRGKDADVVILSGPPLEIRSRVDEVFVSGASVWTRE